LYLNCKINQINKILQRIKRGLVYIRTQIEWILISNQNQQGFLQFIRTSFFIHHKKAVNARFILYITQLALLLEEKICSSLIIVFKIIK